MIQGTVYGVALNDRQEATRLESAFGDKPYLTAPEAPVVYIKPRNCFLADGGVVRLPAGAETVTVQPTLLMELARPARQLSTQDALSVIGAVRLAIDVSLPTDSYYRPVIAEKCQDGFLPLGAATAAPEDFSRLVITTEVNSASVHEWSLDRLTRSTPELIAALSSFMTLEAGDALLIGLPGDAPSASAGQHITISANGFPSLSIRLAPEARP